MKKIKTSDLILYFIIGIILFYLGYRIAIMYYSLTSLSAIDRLGYISEHLSLLIIPEFSLSHKPFLWGLGFLGVFALLIIYIQTTRHNFMTGVEHGSASWGTPADIKPFIDFDNKDNNMIFTQTEKMSINTRKTMRNNNVLVIGGSGSGKTRFCVKPNLMQLHSSYVITDPKGSLIGECGKMFEDAGYKIKSLNLLDFSKSNKYNPFKYIRSEKDILQLADMIIKNCGGKNEKEDFWIKAERLLYQALIAYVHFELSPELQNFSSLLKILNAMEVREEDEGFENVVDYLFKDVEADKNKNQYCVLQYKKFKQAAGKTAKSILISCGVRLSPFDVKEVRELTEKDEMDLASIGTEKTAVFIVTDDTSSTFNFLAAMFYSQLFNTLCNFADTNEECRMRGNRLPVHVRCMLDEFANIGQIPDFEKLIATIRSREISATIILQNMAQLEALYDKNAGTIVGNCDTMLFLGSGEDKTMKSISEKVGKTTIDYKGTSTQKGQYGSYTVNDQIIGRELLTPAEVGLLPNDECLLFIRGVKPFKSKKFDITKHKRYKFLSDSNSKNYFKFEDYQKRQAEKTSQKQKTFDADLTFNSEWVSSEYKQNGA